MSVFVSLLALALLLSMYSTHGHMVNASKFIYDIYTGTHPYWCMSYNFGMWHIGIVVVGTYFAVVW